MQKPIFLDIGNTNTKWKYRDKYFIFPTKDFELVNLPQCSKIWVSNVTQRIFDYRKSNATLVESKDQYKSLSSAYCDKKSLGSDRWLAMIACYEICKNNSFILIDIGSAVTIDFVDSLSKHQGGLIFPGLGKIRQTFDSFPLCQVENIKTLGNSTQQCWSKGTLILLVNLINHKINELKIESPDAHIFITGGGFEDIRNYLDFDYEYHKNLVLDGLEFFSNNM